MAALASMATTEVAVAAVAAGLDLGFIQVLKWAVVLLLLLVRAVLLVLAVMAAALVVAVALAVIRKLIPSEQG